MSANTVAIRSAVRNALTDCTAGDLILVAVSGGADSLALAYALSLEAPKLALRIEGVTVDHQLQSQSSVQAEKVVAALSNMGIEKTHVIKVDVDITDGLEASARRARYAALDARAEKTGAAFILLGHTRDDQSESVLLGLARGSGARSLSAMAMRNGKYLRPLLAITREETLGTCAEAQLDPWDDPHNADKTFTRVRVRHDVIPNLEKNLGPGISAALARTASLLRDDADALDQLAEEEFAAHEPLSLDINRLEKLPKAIRTRVLRMAIYAAGAPSGSLSADHITPIEAFITDWRGQGPSDLPGGVRVSRISGRLSLSR
jgi:tRNA(Ile)-lysidine synthase